MTTRVCSHCYDLGDKRHMIPEADGLYHGRCYVAQFGEAKFLKLPSLFTGPITLDDIGEDLMRRLLDTRSPLPAANRGDEHG